jgi:hypothetical protein
VPILHVCGGADTYVSPGEHTRVVEKRYRALGGEMTVVIKRAASHLPHGLKDAGPVVEFIAENAKRGASK